jgi:hypothetical protein
MSYRNPQIVQPAKVGEIYGAGIAQFGKNISKGIDAYALKQEKILKEQQAELKKQQDLYNKVDFEKAQMTANFQQKTKKYQLSDQLRPIADQAIKNFGDAKIALLTETDPAKRAEYNKMLQNSYSTLIDAEAFVGALQADSQDYLSIQNAGEIGITKGIAATGADATINQEFLQTISAMKLDGSINITQDLENGSLNVIAYRGDGSQIRSLNSTKYLQSGNSLIYDIPDTNTEFLKDVDKQVLNDKGGFKDEFIGEFESTTLTIGNDKYNQTYRKVNTNAVVKAAAPAIQGQVASYNAMTNQQKEDVWANQLNKNRSEALTATDEQIAKAYQDLLIKDIGTQPGLTTINGEYALAGNPIKIDPPKPTKASKPSKKEITAGKMANDILAEGNVFNFPRAPQSNVIQTIGNLEIKENDTALESTLNRMGFNVKTARDEDDKFVGYDINLKGAPKTSRIELDVNKPISKKDFYRELLIASGYDVPTAKSVADELLNALTIRGGFTPPTQDEMNAADLLQKYTTK